MINCRLLPSDEYHKLKKVWPFREGKPIPDKDFSKVMVAENDGNIIAYWFAVQVIHVEPVWVSEEARDGGITATKLLKGLVEELHSCDIHDVYVFSDRDEISQYLGRLGFHSLPDTKVFFGEV